MAAKSFLGTVRMALCLAAFLLSACAQPNLDANSTRSFAFAKPATGALPSTAQEFRKGRSASLDYVVPLDTGNQALGARLNLIDQAEKSLDLKYFLMKPDYSSALITDALLRAADRGVRVRLLLDDIFTRVRDQDLLVLDRHPRIEVRIFNPAGRPGPKWTGLVSDFNRMNRRMHNKAFVADNTIAILGGRNLADEYFQINTAVEFADFEIAVMGPVVADISNGFDLFWNDGWAVPVSALKKKTDEDSIAKRRQEIEEDVAKGQDIYRRAINDPLFDDIGARSDRVLSGKASFVTDAPSKLKVPVAEGQRILAEKLFQRMKSARSSVVILTPYFVPEDYGARLYKELAERGVRVQIITNSVGSTNHVYTHAGYQRHRAPLLSAGVALNEVRADALKVLRPEAETPDGGIVMHTKLVIIDQTDVFVGSMNLDPRSVKLNSESGLFIKSPGFARHTLQTLKSAITDYTYDLQLQDEGKIAWIYSGQLPASATLREPGSTAWRRFVIGITEFLSVELQL